MNHGIKDRFHGLSQLRDEVTEMIEAVRYGENPIELLVRANHIERQAAALVRDLRHEMVASEEAA
jgi:hypothetical protein